MNYTAFLEKLQEEAKNHDLKVEIAIEGHRNISIWIWSLKYATGKFITADELYTIGAINFMEIAAKADMNKTVHKLSRLGYSNEEIESRFKEALVTVQRP